MGIEWDKINSPEMARMWSAYLVFATEHSRDPHRWGPSNRLRSYGLEERSIKTIIGITARGREDILRIAGQEGSGPAQGPVSGSGEPRRPDPRAPGSRRPPPVGVGLSGMLSHLYGAWCRTPTAAVAARDLVLLRMRLMDSEFRRFRRFLEDLGGLEGSRRAP